MVTIKIKKKTLERIGLIFLGIFLSLLILEVGLRLGGYALLSWQRSGNAISGENVYSIMTLGESTTANLRFGKLSWPQELESILNSKVRILNLRCLMKVLVEQLLLIF
jgi:hypothetical protein